MLVFLWVSNKRIHLHWNSEETSAGKPKWRGSADHWAAKAKTQHAEKVKKNFFFSIFFFGCTVKDWRSRRLTQRSKGLDVDLLFGLNAEVNYSCRFFFFFFFQTSFVCMLPCLYVMPGFRMGGNCEPPFYLAHLRVRMSRKSESV